MKSFRNHKNKFYNNEISKKIMSQSCRVQKKKLFTPKNYTPRELKLPGKTKNHFLNSLREEKKKKKLF